ncbi:hypothetical protein ACHAPT_002960, partial [Fusarium lateritium]
MPKVRSSRRVNTRSNRQQPLARRSVSREPQSESVEQRELRELREQHERLQHLERADTEVMPTSQVGSFSTDSIVSATPLEGHDLDVFAEMTLPNLTNGGPVGGSGSGMPTVNGLHYPGSQSTLAATAATAMAAAVTPPWASPQVPSFGLNISLGRTAGEVAFLIYGNDIRIDSALCKKLAGERALRDPIQRRPEAKLNMERRSNVEAFLGYISGTLVARPCKSCHKGHGPWKECVMLDGQLCGSCTNCWFNASGSRCTFH